MLTNIDDSVSPLDAKARRKAQDVRRMHYRRAIESYAERERRFGDVGASGEGEGAVGGLDDVMAEGEGH